MVELAIPVQFYSMDDLIKRSGSLEDYPKRITTDNLDIDDIVVVLYVYIYFFFCYICITIFGE